MYTHSEVLDYIRQSSHGNTAGGSWGGVRSELSSREVGADIEQSEIERQIAGDDSIYFMYQFMVSTM